MNFLHLNLKTEQAFHTIKPLNKSEILKSWKNFETVFQPESQPLASSKNPPRSNLENFSNPQELTALSRTWARTFCWEFSTKMPSPSLAAAISPEERAQSPGARPFARTVERRATKRILIVRDRVIAALSSLLSAFQAGVDLLHPRKEEEEGSIYRTKTQETYPKESGQSLRLAKRRTQPTTRPARTRERGSWPQTVARGPRQWGNRPARCRAGGGWGERQRGSPQRVPRRDTTPEDPRSGWGARNRGLWDRESPRRCPVEWGEHDTGPFKSTECKENAAGLDTRNEKPGTSGNETLRLRLTCRDFSRNWKWLWGERRLRSQRCHKRW